MSAPTIKRRPGEPCDWCGVASGNVALARYEVRIDDWAPLVGEVLVCAPCAERAARVARGHEPCGS
jgi:hypothetical protein